MKFIIDFFDSASAEAIDVYLTDNGLSVDRTFPSLGKIYLVSGDNTPPVTSIVETIKTNASQPISLLATDTTFDINADNNWWKTYSIGHSIDYTQSTVTIPGIDAFFDVYVVDSGINSSHSEFTGQTVTELYSVNSTFIDETGHGTAIASLISGNTCALARANLVSVKVIDSTSTITLGGILAALDAIKTHSDSRPSTPAVANMSWSIPFDVYVNAKIEQLINSGVLVICSAGNSGVAISDVTPASVDSAFVVGSYTQDFVPADFSNYTGDLSTSPNIVNPGVIDVWAPGVGIYVANKDGGFSTIGGTSTSAAIATGSLVYTMNYAERIFINEFGSRFLKSTNTADHFFPKRMRQGLLTLDNQYTGSANRIVTYMHTVNTRAYEIWHNGIKGQTYSHTQVAREMENVFYVCYDPDDVETITIQGTAPEGFQMINGCYAFTMPALDDPSSSYVEYNFDIVLTSYDTTVTTIDMTMFHVNSNQAILDNIPDDDLNKPILIVPTANGNNCRAHTPPPSCFQVNDCNAGEICDTTGKSSCDCVA